MIKVQVEANEGVEAVGVPGSPVGVWGVKGVGGEEVGEDLVEVQDHRLLGDPGRGVHQVAVEEEVEGPGQGQDPGQGDPRQAQEEAAVRTYRAHLSTSSRGSRSAPFLP